jgi:hypothetical protein
MGEDARTANVAEGEAMLEELVEHITGRVRKYLSGGK